MATDEIYRRGLTGLLPLFNFVCEGFTLRDKFSLDELERTLVKAEELIKQPEGTSAGDKASFTQCTPPASRQVERFMYEC